MNENDIMDELFYNYGCKTGEVIHKAMEEAILLGNSHVVVTVDSLGDISMYHKSTRDAGAHQGVIVVGDDFPSHYDRFKDVMLHRELKLVLPTVCAEIPDMDDWWRLSKISVMPGVADPWHPKQLSKKKYQAPRQSFRTSMRSPNRNR